MSEKSTKELTDALGKTHTADFQKFIDDNKDSLNGETESFGDYVREIIYQRGMTQQLVFLKADIPERYGYKLLSGEKKTRQRDVILRICYGATLTLEETQKALRKSKLPEFYAKTPRDALIMIAFNERPGSIIEVNELLKKNGFEPLRSSGVQN